MFAARSAREQRLVALLILMALIAALVLLVIEPITQGFAARREARAELADDYARNIATIAAIPRLTRRAERQKAALADFALTAPDAAAGQDMLRERLQHEVQQVGGDLRSTEDGAAQPGWVSTRIDARLRTEQLAALLRQVQNEPPFVIIDTLAIAADDALVTGRPTAMEVVLEAKVPLRLAQTR